MITASNEVKTAQNKTNREVEDENTKRAFQGIKTSRPRRRTVDIPHHWVTNHTQKNHYINIYVRGTAKMPRLILDFTIFSKEEEQEEEHSSLGIQRQFRPKPPFSQEQCYAHNFKTQQNTTHNSTHDYVGNRSMHRYSC